MKIAIVDDEREMRSQLAGYIERLSMETGAVLTPEQFECGDALLSGYSPVYDIIIFDIDMPGTSGLDCARRIRAMDDNVVILFVTNIAQYAINGYEVEAVDYIIKPIGYYDFSLKFQRAMRRVTQRQADNLMVDSLNGPVRLCVEDVTYVEVFAHYLVYHTLKEDIQARGSMKEHEALLRGRGFCRTHKSFMVNMRHIDNIRASEVIVNGGSIPLGRTYKDELMNAYLQFLRG